VVFLGVGPLRVEGLSAEVFVGVDVSFEGVLGEWIDTTITSGLGRGDLSVGFGLIAGGDGLTEGVEGLMEGVEGLMEGVEGLMEGVEGLMEGVEGLMEGFLIDGGDGVDL
jgi:hypothetical protein